MFDNFTPNPKPGKTKKKSKKPIPKRSKKWKAPTLEESQHLQVVKSYPCCVCNRGAPSEAHHITDCGRRRGHYYTIPLCPEHHRTGKITVKHKKKFIERFGSEEFLLKRFWKKINFDERLL